MQKIQDSITVDNLMVEMEGSMNEAGGEQRWVILCYYLGPLLHSFMAGRERDSVH